GPAGDGPDLRVRRHIDAERADPAVGVDDHRSALVSLERGRAPEQEDTREHERHWKTEEGQPPGSQSPSSPSVTTKPATRPCLVVTRSAGNRWRSGTRETWTTSHHPVTGRTPGRYRFLTARGYRRRSLATESPTRSPRGLHDRPVRYALSNRTWVLAAHGPFRGRAP